MRRASSGLAKVSTPPSSTRNSKGSKPSKTVCLKLPRSALARFVPDTPDEAASPIPVKKPTFDSTAVAPPRQPESKPSKVKPEASSPPDEVADPSTPQPLPKESSAKTTTKASSPKTGSKRALGAGVDGPKPKTRPGPKKKSKLDDANGDPGIPAVRAAAVPTAPAHKLGPKANQGAINAGLRALDRTGKPCRKWQKNGFRIKTFTGVTWELPSWRSASKSLGSRDSPGKGSLPTSNSQSKENSSSHVGSENSSATPNAGIKDELASSPAPAIAVAT
ncbi:MAG: hypothetical protein Q9219_006335 [cf. Caloplaca sp. 3 TL-2023]